ncbi:MAG: S1C family serine protease [Lachnospiraceae bacterium]|nr:S1C family serine protease [Lachnospiraceae bacterium]
MSDSNTPKGTPEAEPSSKKEFIRETIEEKKPSKRKWIRRILLLLVQAVAFGLIAALTFALSEPRLKELLAGEETEEAIQFSRDSLEAETTAEAEDSESSESSTEADEEALKETVEELVEGYLSTRESEEEEAAYTELVSDMASALRRSMVTVTSIQASEDIFQQEYVRSQETFGLILTETSSRMLILTETYLVKDTETVLVTLGNKSEYSADLVGVDETTGLAVVGISLEEMTEGDLSYVEPVALGNSYICQAGDTVVALGNPMGYVPSVAWGIISYINTAQQGIDMNFQLIQTDIAGSSEATGILVNLDGEVVGWITQDYSSDDTGNMLAAMSISDIKGYIERVSNGEAMACLGVQVQVVTASFAEERQLPQGLYISSCISGGAAYEAGLQNGDILTGIGEETITTISGLQEVLTKYEPGETVTVIVMRSSRSGYVEQTFQVKLGER